MLFGRLYGAHFLLTIVGIAGFGLACSGTQPATTAVTTRLSPLIAQADSSHTLADWKSLLADFLVRPDSMGLYATHWFDANTQVNVHVLQPSNAGAHASANSTFLLTISCQGSLAAQRVYADLIAYGQSLWGQPTPEGQPNEVQWHSPSALKQLQLHREQYLVSLYVGAPVAAASGLPK